MQVDNLYSNNLLKTSYWVSLNKRKSMATLGKIYFPAESLTAVGKEELPEKITGVQAINLGVNGTQLN